MGVKIYISGISGNKEVKKRQQRVCMILESRNISYSVVDITEPGKEADRDFMQTKSTSLGVTASDLSPRHPLPPQIFNDEEYCGDYDQFDLSNEIDELDIFLKLAPAKSENSEVPNTEASLDNGTTEEPEPATEPVEEPAEEPVEEEEEPEEEVEPEENNGTTDEVSADVAA